MAGEVERSEWREWPDNVAAAGGQWPRTRLWSAALSGAPQASVSGQGQLAVAGHGHEKRPLPRGKQWPLGVAGEVAG